MSEKPFPLSQNDNYKRAYRSFPQKEFGPEAFKYLGLQLRLIFLMQRFSGSKVELWSLPCSATSQRATEGICLPSPWWSPSQLEKDRVGRGNMLERGPRRAFDLGGQGDLPHSMSRCPHLDATESGDLFLRGGSEKQGAEEV